MDVLFPLYVAASLIAAPIHHKPMNFNEALDRTLAFEGGGRTHTVRGDPGGTTKWGISQRAYPDRDIASLTKDEAAFLYRRDYWEAVRADLLPPELRPHVFDSAVNQGTSKAVRLLQEALNLYATITPHGEFVVVDGELGPHTLDVVRDYPPERLTTLFRHLRAQHYVQLAEAGRGKFLFGWLKRV